MLGNPSLVNYESLSLPLTFGDPQIKGEVLRPFFYDRQAVEIHGLTR